MNQAHVSRRWLDYAALPREMTRFEASYLRLMNRIALFFFAAHVPAMMLVAWMNGTGPGLAALITGAVVAGPTLAYFTLTNPRFISITMGIAAMFMGGVLVHFGQGPMQIEMHFYFFALIAMLAVFANPLVIIAAALTVTLHHLVLWAVLPRSVFNYEASVWVVAVHAAFVVLESAATCFIARSFFDNVIGLEKIIKARTEELDGRNRDMRLVLDHVDQGLVTIDRDGIPSDERSRILETWFGLPGPKETIFDWIGRSLQTFVEVSALGWDEVKAGVLPLELTLEQMPRQLLLGAAQYRIEYMPIGQSESPERFLVVVTDVTAELHNEHAERERREAARLFERLLHERVVVQDFFEDCSDLVRAIGKYDQSDLSRLKRMLHTLKGNTAIFELDSIASICNDLEFHIAEEGSPPPASETEKLMARWAALDASVARFIGVRRNVIEIEEPDHAELEEALRRGTAAGTVFGMVHSMKLEPTQKRLEHFGEQIRRIGSRLDKNIDVRVEGNNLRVDPKHWSRFWGAFIHAVRNAVDHGLETSGERVNQGKPARGRIDLRTSARGDRFVIEIADDGRGIHWDKIAQKAKEMGLPCSTPGDLRAALFHDGLTTATEITDLSGRGVGMAALLEATESLGGVLEIETKLGAGTTLRMSFPKEAMSPDMRPTFTSNITTARQIGGPS